jgi:hypothetical protein
MKLPAETTASVWHTLVGLKLLSQYFDRNQIMWILIANKARKALRERLGFSGDLETALSQFKVQLGVTF